MAPKSKKAAKQEGSNPSKTRSTSLKNALGRPNWPPLTPLVPTASLYLDTHTPGQILLIRNLFTSTLCSRYISYLSTLPLTTTPLTKSRDLAVRVNDRFQIDDPSFARQLWTQTSLRDLILAYEDQTVFSEGGGQSGKKPPEILGLNPNIRIYRYRAGQFFDQHYDESNNLSLPVPRNQEAGNANAADANAAIATKTIPAKTTWTLLIYLSICQGGETVFYPERRKGERGDPEPVSVAPEVGLALLHRHGESCMLHEGKKVTGGEKWVLRSDLVVGR